MKNIVNFGGVIEHGIPEFRLEPSILENTVNKILDLGIKVKYNKELGKNVFLSDLEREYDAIFLSFGKNISSKMKIEGEELAGVLGGNELLENKDYPNFNGKKVIVSGGGNVAMDTCRTIKRLGASKVTVVYRRSEDEMPAEKIEIKEAKEDGVEFLFQTNLLKIIGNEKVEQIECIKTELIEKEGETRKVPVNINGSNFKIDADYVVMAVGSITDSNLLNTLKLETTKKGTIVIDENYKTSREKIYAGGDLSRGKRYSSLGSTSWKRCSRSNKKGFAKGGEIK